MAEEAERIGARMAERRKELGLKQREVADRIPGSTEGKDISRWENGKHRPQGDTLQAIATALETDIADLYAGRVADRKPKGATPDPFADDPSQLGRVEAKLDALSEKVAALDARLRVSDTRQRSTGSPPQSQADQHGDGDQ